MKLIHATSALLALAAAAAAQTQVPIPAHNNVYNGYTRGYSFTAQNNFIISQVELPLDAYQANDTASFYLRVNTANTFFNVGGTSATQSTSIVIAPGDVVDVFGNWSPLAAGTFTAHNSYSPSATNFATTIEGAATTLARNGVQNDIGNPGYVQGGNILGQTTGQIGRIWIYTNPAVGLYPNFTATPTAGPVGMTVNFTDATFTSDPGGVLAWSWDLDGDSVVDSTAQNPTFTYAACGDYDVTLSVVDASNPAASITKTAFIHVGNTAIAPNFTYTQIAPDTFQFTDTSSPMPASWAWDFDGDSIIDSTAQNPVWVYPTCTVTAAVTLSVTNTCSGPFSTTQTLTLLPPMVASFTYSAIAPGVFQFTDTSVPLPTSWAWDLDGDGITDSTSQNPVWAYTSPCTSVNVSLTASDNCSNSGSTTRPIIAAPASATAVPFSGGNGTTGNPVVGNMFDISVTANAGINVCALEQGIYTYVGPFTADVYITEGSYIGKEANASAWRLVASGSGNCATAGALTPATAYPVALNAPFYLPRGDYGVAVYLSQPAGTMYVAYSNGPLGPYANGDITFFPNPATAPGRSNYGVPFSGTGFSPRCWNGTFHYTKAGAGDVAGYGFMGTGCPGSMGVSHLTPNAPPVLGTTMNVAVDNLPVNAAIMLTGFSNTNWLLGALPYYLTSYGAPGCQMRVSPDANLLLLGAGNTATWTFNTPNATGLVGLTLFNQAVVLDPGFNGAGAVGSDAAGMMIGL